MNMNKKANVFDAMDSFIIVVFAVILLVIVGVVLKSFYAEGEAQGIFNTTAHEPAKEFSSNFGSKVDWVAPFLLFALMIASLIFAFKIPSNSAFFVISLFAVPFIGLMIMVIGEIAYTFITDAAVTTVTATMPITLFLFQGKNPLILGIIYILVTYVALYAGKDE